MKHQGALMTDSGTAAVPPQNMPENESGKEQIDTRFGRVTIYRKNPIIFPNGVLGMPDKFEFCLTKFPSEKLARFKLLQSLDDEKLSFITLPADMDNPLVEKADMIAACKDLDIPEKDVTLLFIVTVHRQTGSVKLSVNSRAPIFINAPKRLATQYVFHSNKYKIQHMISM